MSVGVGVGVSVRTNSHPLSKRIIILTDSSCGSFILSSECEQQQ